MPALAWPEARHRPVYAGIGNSLQSVSEKQDAMSQVADQVLYQARRVTNRVADISNNLVVLQQAGVITCAPLQHWHRHISFVMLDLLVARCC